METWQPEGVTRDLREPKTKALSVRANLLIAALVPLALFSLGAAASMYVYATSHRESDVRAKLDTVGAFLIEGSRLGFMTESPEILEGPARSAFADPDIVHLSIYSRDGRLLFALGDGFGALALAPDALAGSEVSYRVAGPGRKELRRVARYPVEDLEAEALGFMDPGASGEPARLGPPEGLIRVVMSTERADAEYRTVLLSSAAVLGVVLILASLLVYWLGHGVIRALGLLGQAVQQIGRGDLDVQVPALGGGEIARLGAAFNEMSAQLRSARREIEDYQADLEDKVRARTAELDAARIEAERANRAKSEFLANMSHEIRTPITAILGYTEMLIDGDPDLPPASRAQLEIVRRNGSHLLELLNDILDLSKIEAGRLNVEQIPTNVAQLVAEVASLMRVRASEKSVSLTTRFVDLFPTMVISDPTRIRQVLVNLTGNAIKFTSAGSVDIRVGYDLDSELARIEVRDTGVGIATDKLATLFRPFEQADNSVTRQFGGTGLGLAITKRVALLLGGDCELESQLGRGSRLRFEFRAPLAEGAELVETDGEAEIRKITERAVASGGARRRISGRLLLAEDGLDNQRLISMILRKAGAEVVIVENGRLAVERAAREAFDAIVMDMAMPVMDGYTATRTLRDMGYEKPILALTAHALSGERERCLDAGCTEYLTKPVNQKQLVELIASLLDREQKREASADESSAGAPPPTDSRSE